MKINALKNIIYKKQELFTTERFDFYKKHFFFNWLNQLVAKRLKNFFEESPNLAKKR